MAREDRSDGDLEGSGSRPALGPAPQDRRRRTRRPAGHGGEHRAVFVYQIESYRYWQDRLGRTDFTYGQFGENFTVEGMSDDEVCIGDRYPIGEALFEVTQPRVTCYRVGIRMNEPQMAALLTSSGKPGFYLRVLQEGEVEAGDEIIKVADGPERMTIAEINALLYLPDHSRQQLERALRIPVLSEGWRGSFQAILQQESGGDPMTGNAGLGRARRSARRMAGFSPTPDISHRPREQQYTLTRTRARGRTPPSRCQAWPVRRAAPAAEPGRATAVAKLLAL